MSANTTDSPGHGMDCGRVAREEIVESYLLGRLSEQDREAFEAHCFECASCFDHVKTLKAIQGELRRAGGDVEAKTTRPTLRWASAAGLAAAAVLTIGVVLWMRAPLPSGLPPQAQDQLPSPTKLPDRPPPPAPAVTVAPVPALEQLARVDPPRYEPATLRGAPDEATARFQHGMERYGKADYEAAVADLRAAAELDPDAAHVRFFLGISHLLLGQDNAAIDWLRATIKLGDSAYLEEAHFYLAKAFLRRKDLRAAETQLKEVIKLRGSSSDEARRLLADLERLKDR